MYVILAAALAALSMSSGDVDGRATPQELARAQTQMFSDYDPRVMEFANRLKITEPWITYCRIQMNESHSGHERDGTLPFGVDYRELNKDQVEPLMRLRSAYEESFLKKCLADVRVSLKNAGVK